MSPPSALALYGRALDAELELDTSVYWADGSVHPLALACWRGPLTTCDESALCRTTAPVLDVGCGPGRHVAALARRGVLALGVDASPAAVRAARARGATAIVGSVFDTVPGAGTWGSALLLDGNIGIGGSPVALLRRVGALLAPGGSAIVELERPGIGLVQARGRLEHDGETSRWFEWARVGIDAIDLVAGDAGLEVAEQWRCERRRFARLVRP